jgi:hypothetical protein
MLPRYAREFAAKEAGYTIGGITRSAPHGGTLGDHSQEYPRISRSKRSAAAPKGEKSAREWGEINEEWEASISQSVLTSAWIHFERVWSPTLGARVR